MADNQCANAQHTHTHTYTVKFCNHNNGIDAHYEHYELHTHTYNRIKLNSKHKSENTKNKYTCYLLDCFPVFMLPMVLKFVGNKIGKCVSERQ